MTADKPRSSLRQFTLGSKRRLPAVPEARTGDAVLPGFGRVRFRYLNDDAAFIEAGLAARARERTHGGREWERADLLALSGGGEDGAFGGGFLVGWSEQGSRPRFKVVTGVSVGSLIAPFALLGSSWDWAIEETFAQLAPDRILKWRSALAALTGDAFADTRPLREAIWQRADDELIEAVAAAHRQGQVLLVATTNLDAAEQCIWDLTAIAATGGGPAKQLFRQVLLAACAVPGVFAPVLIDVEVDGVPHQEMHVDGGCHQQIFVYPSTISLAEIRRRDPALRRPGTLYLIRNAHSRPRYEPVPPRALAIAQRAIWLMVGNQGTGDLYRIFAQTLRDDLEFRLAGIPDDFDVRRGRQRFDPNYTKGLFACGRDLARAGYAWHEGPPGLDPRGLMLARSLAHADRD